MWNYINQQKIYQKVRFTGVIFAVLLGLVPGWGFAATPAQEWVSRYNGAGNMDDLPFALTTDIAGNVYVTGLTLKTSTSSAATIEEYVTVKYDANGNQLWEAHYNGPGETDNDFATAIAVDTAGNVYVTGQSEGMGTSTDYATVKYDANGNQLWVARYNGPGNSIDSASALAVDAHGNVYVAGGSYGAGTYSDYATVKYDSNGNQLWVARYNGPDGYYDVVRALAVDTAGNVYVTGSSGAATGTDYATLKYDANGTQLWVKRYNGTGNIDDTALALAVDVAGNVVVTGSSGGAGGYYDYDYATIKYDSNGNQLWLARYNGPASSNDAAFALAIDAAGNTYVTGYSTGSTTSADYATIKYDSNGNQLWITNYSGPGGGDDVARAMAVDATGNIYVTGYSAGSGTGYDYATIEYDTNGNQLWINRYNGLANGSDIPVALALDAAGKVYITGYSAGSGTYNDFATITYSPASANQPPVAAAQSISTPEDIAVSIALSGNDPGGEPITFSIAALPAHGTLSGTAPNLSYKPNSNYNGADSFTFRVNDGTLVSAPATVSIMVTPINDVPIANAGSDQVIRTILPRAAVKLNGSASRDIDGDALVYTWSGSFGLVRGISPVVMLAPGLYPITLMVSDGQATTTDTVVIKVIN